MTRKFMAATLVSEALQRTVEVQSSFRTEKLRFMKSWVGGPETTWLLVLGCKAGEETQVLRVPVLSSHGGESEHLRI